MAALWKSPHLGIAVAVISPFLALGFGEMAFFPVLVTSALGGAVCALVKLGVTDLQVGQLKAELVRELESAEQDHRERLLAEFTKAERDVLLAEIRRSQSELRTSHRRSSPLGSPALLPQ